MAQLFVVQQSARVFCVDEKKNPMLNNFMNGGFKFGSEHPR